MATHIDTNAILLFLFTLKVNIFILNFSFSRLSIYVCYVISLRSEEIWDDGVLVSEKQLDPDAEFG